MDSMCCQVQGLRRSVAGALTLLLSLPGVLAAQFPCGETSPAMPTPQFLGNVELWPDNFRPGKPGQPLPPQRDSTQYNSQLYPGWRTGLELFWSIAAVDPFVFTSYNVGIHAWDAGGNRAEDPVQVSVRDGLEGHWLFHPTMGGEGDGIVEDIDAIQDPNDSDNIIVAVAATGTIGVSLWKFSRTARQLIATYQNTGRESHDVDLIAVGGRVYALYASIAGPFVLDASAGALLGGCLDDACPSTIDRGKIANATGSRFVNGIVKDGQLYVMSSYGGFAPSVPMPELWALADPAAPATAVRRHHFTIKDLSAGTMIKKGSLHYLAAVVEEHVKIFPFENCLDGDGCTALQAPVFAERLRDQTWQANFLTYSESNGRPFLYYGCSDCFNFSGAAIERLYDLSNLGGSNLITDITASGGTYSDNLLPNSPCLAPHHGIGYWSHQYAYNRYGLRNFNPRRGLFNGLYFYRVTYATFDVHVRTETTTDPTTSTAVATAPPHWLGEDVDVVANAENCPGPETWTFATDPYAYGVSGTGPNDATATLHWNLCATDDCPPVFTEVWATKAACASAGNLQINAASVTLEDPRPRIRAIGVSPAGNPPGTYPLCSVLTFAADIDGKTPFTYLWTARSQQGQELATGSGATFVWNTTGVPLNGPEIFGDGFESGDLSEWFGASPITPLAAAPTPAEIVRGAGGSAPFTIELRATNPNSQQDVESRVITLHEPGALGFGSPEISVTDLGSASYRFAANTDNATEWRWEFEDPAFGTVGACQVLAAARCSVIEFGQGAAEATHQWAAPNSNGPYRVAVLARNCTQGAIASSPSFTVNVTGINANPPAVSQFKVDTAAWNPGNICDDDSAILNTYFCHANQWIPFHVTSTGATHLQLDWDRDGVYEEEIAATAGITHRWNEIGPLVTGKPRVRARNGATLSSPVDLAKFMTILP